jgi:hypothetical protein
MRGVDGEAVTSDLYPDIGCLRFAEARGVCHALRPLHSWRLIVPFMLEARESRESREPIHAPLRASFNACVATQARALFGGTTW